MANNTKKKPAASASGKKQTAAKQSAARSGANASRSRSASGAAAKKPAARTTKQKQEELARIEAERIENANKRVQRAALGVCVAALLIGCVVFIPAKDGTPWFMVRSIFFGMLGYAAFGLPFVLLYVSIRAALQKLRFSMNSKLVASIILAFLVMGLGYVISRAPETVDFNIAVTKQFHAYRNGEGFGWGAVGAIIGEGLMRLSDSKIPAVCILIIASFVDVMILTGSTMKGLVTGVQNTAERAGQYAEPAPDPVQYEGGRQEKVAVARRRIRRETEPADDVIDPDEPMDEEIEVVFGRGRKTAGKTQKKAEEPPAEPQTPPWEEPEPPADGVDPEITAVFGREHVLIDNETGEVTPVKVPVSPIPIQPTAYVQTDAGQQPDAEPEKKKLRPEEIAAAQQGVADEIESQPEPEPEYVIPDIELLRKPVKNPGAASQADLRATGEKLIACLNNFNVNATVTGIVPGPAVTRYEVTPGPGVKISKFTGLADDIALGLAAPAAVRIEAPIPNKSAIGIEIPNRGRTTVTMREIVDSDVYRRAKSVLNVALGKDIAGNVICADLAKMPHLLVAGTTGSGKSVCLNAMIVSLLYNAGPQEVKLVLIDPKQVEFSVYNGVPHLLVPVVSDARKAAGALGWAVSEMLNRYNMLNELGVRDIDGYNEVCKQDDSLKPMSRIVIIIDELSDLMAVAPGDVETSIMRLAQMARAAGMHLVVATQRPSVDVITGLIKANIPSRIALTVGSQVDSRTIIDMAGAEKLLGLGDMLFLPMGMSKPQRIQGCYLSDSEIERVVSFVKEQGGQNEYSDEIQSEIEKQALNTQVKKGSRDVEPVSDGSDKDHDLVMKAAELMISNPEKASVSSIQRYLSLGYAKAGRIMDTLEEMGVVGPTMGSKPRKVLMTKAQWYELCAAQSAPVSGENESDEEV